ncbi:MAG: hypothetical protein WAT91_14015 [Saprospiraceae bacterium]
MITLSYPDLELYLFSPREKGIQSCVFASVYFGNATSVNFHLFFKFSWEVRAISRQNGCR